MSARRPTPSLRKMERGAIAFDLDGTLATYAGDGAGAIGPPIPGMREVVTALVQRRQPVVVFTARDDTQAVRTWLFTQGFPAEQIRITNQKDPSLRTFVDDRALRFAPTMVDTPEKQRHFLDLVLRFKPYWQQGKSLRIVASLQKARDLVYLTGAADGHPDARTGWVTPTGEHVEQAPTPIRPQDLDPDNPGPPTQWYHSRLLDQHAEGRQFQGRSHEAVRAGWVRYSHSPSEFGIHTNAAGLPQALHLLQTRWAGQRIHLDFEHGPRPPGAGTSRPILPVESTTVDEDTAAIRWLRERARGLTTPIQKSLNRDWQRTTLRDATDRIWITEADEVWHSQGATDHLTFLESHLPLVGSEASYSDTAFTRGWVRAFLSADEANVLLGDHPQATARAAAFLRANAKARRFVVEGWNGASVVTQGPGALRQALDALHRVHPKKKSRTATLVLKGRPARPQAPSYVWPGSGERSIHRLSKFPVRRCFEYHCQESHDSADAELWYRSHQTVTVTRQLHPSESDFEMYEVHFDDGHVGHVMADEIMRSPKSFQRPGPPRRPAQKSQAQGAVEKSRKGYVSPRGEEFDTRREHDGVQFEDHTMLARRITGDRDADTVLLRTKGYIRFWDTEGELALDFHPHADTVARAVRFIQRNYRRGQRIYLDIPTVTGVAHEYDSATGRRTVRTLKPAFYDTAHAAVAMLRGLTQKSLRKALLDRTFGWLEPVAPSGGGAVHVAPRFRDLSAEELAARPQGRIPSFNWSMPSGRRIMASRIAASDPASGGVERWIRRVSHTDLAADLGLVDERQAIRALHVRFTMSPDEIGLEFVDHPHARQAAAQWLKTQPDAAVFLDVHALPTSAPDDDPPLTGSLMFAGARKAANRARAIRWLEGDPTVQDDQGTRLVLKARGVDLQAQPDLFGEGTPWYVQRKLRQRPGHIKLYGPFPDQDTARRAAYFHRPYLASGGPVEHADASDASAMRIFLHRGVQQYDANEIRALTRYPTEQGYAHVRVLPPEGLALHPSWRAHTRESRDRLYAADVAMAALKSQRVFAGCWLHTVTKSKHWIAPDGQVIGMGGYDHGGLFDPPRSGRPTSYTDAFRQGYVRAQHEIGVGAEISRSVLVEVVDDDPAALQRAAAYVQARWQPGQAIYVDRVRVPTPTEQQTVQWVTVSSKRHARLPAALAHLAEPPGGVQKSLKPGNSLILKAEDLAYRVGAPYAATGRTGWVVPTGERVEAAPGQDPGGAWSHAELLAAHRIGRTLHSSEEAVAAGWVRWSRGPGRLALHLGPLGVTQATAFLREQGSGDEVTIDFEHNLSCCPRAGTPATRSARFDGEDADKAALRFIREQQAHGKVVKARPPRRRPASWLALLAQEREAWKLAPTIEARWRVAPEPEPESGTLAPRTRVVLRGPATVKSAATYNATPEGWRKFVVTPYGRLHGERPEDYTHADLIRRHGETDEPDTEMDFVGRGGVAGHVGYEHGRHTVGLYTRADSALGRWNAAHALKKLARPDSHVLVELLHPDGRVAQSVHGRAEALRALFEPSPLPEAVSA